VRALAIVARTRHARATRAVPPFQILEACMRSGLAILFQPSTCARARYSHTELACPQPYMKAQRRPDRA
jgi:hypothetical protein